MNQRTSIAWPWMLAAVLITGVLYVVRLDYSPVYLLNDEIFNALQAWSLAETGRSAGGDRFPVFFRGLEFPPGRDPLCVYGTAAALKLLGLGDVALRAPTALVGVLNVVLVYLVGRKLWHARRAGLIAAAVLATSPGHYIHSRIGIPTLWSLPALLCWLLALLTYAERRDPKYLTLAFGALGFAVYGYFGTALLVPLYLGATLVYVYVTLQVRTLKPYIAAAGGLLLSMIFLIYWQFVHPERWSELFSYYISGPQVLRSGAPLLSPSGLPNFAGVQERVTSYWNYFDPTFLFLRGDASPRYSTGRAGILLLPAVIMLPFGLYRAAKTPGIGRLLVFGFLSAPLAGALGNEVQIQRALPLVLFAALLITWGTMDAVPQRWPRARRVATALGVVAALQFAVFAGDYFTVYRMRSGPSRGGNLRGAIATAVEMARAGPVPRLYLDERIDNARYYWQFYAIALDARDLSPKVEFASLTNVLSAAPEGAVLITAAEDAALDARAASGEWRLRSRILEPDDTAFYAVFEKAAR